MQPKAARWPVSREGSSQTRALLGQTAVVVDVSDATFDSVYGHNCDCDAMSPRTNLHVAGHLGVRLPATPPPQGALDDEELFIVEGSKNPRTSGLNPCRGSPKNGAKCAKKHPFRLKIVIELCR